MAVMGTSNDEGQVGGALTELELAVLAFERQRWKYLGAKAGAVLEEFGWSLTRHAQVVDALIDRPEALAVDGQLVHRLQRLREVRRAQRTRPGRPTVG